MATPSESLVKESLVKVWKHALLKRGKCHVWDKPFTTFDAALAYWHWHMAWITARYARRGWDLPWTHGDAK